MNWNFDDLEKKLNKVSETSKKLDVEMKETINKIADNDYTKQSYEYLSEEEREYRKYNDAYKKYISQYSKSYIEMSEFYYGPELPYNIYCKEFKKTNLRNPTYLDSPKDVKELYALFIFYSMFDSSIREVFNS